MVVIFIKSINLKNFTVFKNTIIEFKKGINVFIGEDGTGKTHVMKLLYSACQCASPKISFSNKIVRTTLPDNYNISRLVTRQQGNNNSSVRVVAVNDNGDEKNLGISFNAKTKKWDAKVTGEQAWEKEFSEISSIFIPAKEILSNSYNLVAATEKNNVKFDDTYIDIINSAKVDISSGRNNADKKTMLERIENIIGGKVTYDTKRDEFYLKVSGSKQEFNLLAEGIRKMSLLWQLVKNGTLEKGSVLFWDEPESNINPKYISVIAEVLFELQRGGVQIFISTHDYMLSKYLELKKQGSDSLLFHSFVKNDGVVECQTAEKFADIKDNDIIESYNALLDEIYDLGE